MATPRRLKGLDTLRDTLPATADILHVLNVGEIPRTALTVRELSLSTGLPRRWLHDRINQGRIRVIGEGLREKVIPLSEIPKILQWAEYENTA